MKELVISILSLSSEGVHFHFVYPIGKTNSVTNFASNNNTNARTSQPMYDRRFASILTKRESASTIPDDEVIDIEKSSSCKIVMQDKTSFLYEGVRFTPKLIEFNDAFDGKQFLQKIEFQNVGKNPVLIRIGEPSSFVFHMDKYDRSTKLLPSGKSIKRILTYVYHNNDIVLRSQIRVQINGHFIDYPIIVRRAQPVIEVLPPELDFKVLNMGASAKILKLTLVNTGGKGTKFAIDLGRNELDLVVNPPRGTIRAKSHINVNVEMVGLTEGEFYRELWITTSERPIRVPISAEVMRPRLEVYHPNATGHFTLINFPPTFRGTQRLDTIVLRNFSADMTPFAIFAEIGGELKGCAEARKLDAAFKMFTVSAEEGRLEPFESRIVTISFRPVKVPCLDKWHSKKSEESKKHPTNEFLVFLRVNRVHCIERHELEGETKAENPLLVQKELDKRHSIMLSVASIMAIPGYQPNFVSTTKLYDPEHTSFSSSTFPTPIEDKDVVRLCLHGAVAEPDFLVQPNCFSFEKCQIGVTTKKVLKLINQSLLKMKYICHKAVNIFINPSTGWLQSKQAIDVEVAFTPSFQGRVNNSIKVELFGKSAVLYDNDEEVIKLRTLKISYTAFVVYIPNPGIDSGITSPSQKTDQQTRALVPCTRPKVVGPGKACIVQRKNMIKNLNDKSSDIPIRDRYYNHWAANKVCTALYMNYHGHSPSEEQQIHCIKEMFDKYPIWNHYFNFPRSDHCFEEPLEESFIEELVRKEFSDRRKLSKIDKKKQEDWCKQIQSDQEPKNLISKLVLLPLSPIFLSNVKVEPKLIDFSMVAPNVSVSQTLKLHNMNIFPVSVRFIPGKSGVTLPDGDVRLIPPLGKKMLKIVFRTKDSGRYNGFLDYVINGSHMFKITVSANIVPKTLAIAEKDWSINFGNYSTLAAFQPNSSSICLTNNLQSPIKFHWEMQNDSAFYIEPLSGEVPPMTTLMNQVYFNLQPDKILCSEANLISESGAIQAVKLTYKKPKTNVFFWASKIELDKIALNLQEVVHARLVNVNYNDVPFEVLDCTPLPGIKISPNQGIIKSRCFFDLEIEIKIPVIIDFQFDLRVRIDAGFLLMLKVQGSVVFPMLKVTPPEVTMKRISVQSFDISAICIENIGTTPCHIEINLKEYPEYKITRNKGNLADKVEKEEAYILPKKSCRFFVHFEPKDVARYQFYLPLVINGILGPPMPQDILTENACFFLERYEDSYVGFGNLTRSADLKLKIPCASVNCMVTSHLLKFSSLHIIFQKQLRIPEFQPEEVEIKNMSSSPVSMCLRLDDLISPMAPFKMEVMREKVERYEKAVKIDLQVGEAVILKIMFLPRRAGEFKAKIPVFLEGYNNGYAYNILTLSGESKKASIMAEAKEIHFPPLPPRIGTEVIIQVFAERYTTPEVLSCSVMDGDELDKPSDVIKILWLDEPRISGLKDFESFSVQISFQSYSVISIRTYLVFTDGRGENFPVLLTAAADLCSITTHLFLSTRSSKYKIIRDESITKLDDDAYYGTKSFPKHKTNGLYKKDVKKHRGKLGYRSHEPTQYLQTAKIEPAPKLVVQPTKSMQRLTQLNFVHIEKSLVHLKIAQITNDNSISSEVMSKLDLMSDSTKSSVKTGKGINEASNDVIFPNFPNGEENTYYEKYLKETLKYVELWVYEVVFHCEEYMIIPNSFQTGGGDDEWVQAVQNRDQRWELPKKTVVDLVVALAGPTARHYFPDKPLPLKDPSVRAEYMYNVFNCLLNFLAVQGSFLPHVRPEILLCYKDYTLVASKRSFTESTKYNPRSAHKHTNRGGCGPGQECGQGKNSLIEYGEAVKSTLYFNEMIYDENPDEGEDYDYRERKHEQDDVGPDGIGGRGQQNIDFGNWKDTLPLDEKTFVSRSTQAWLDVILQIFRTLMLPKIVYKKTAMHTGILDSGGPFGMEMINSMPHYTSIPGEYTPKPIPSESFGNPEPSKSNFYTVQERLLLTWLKYHYDVQRTVLWPSSSTSDMIKTPPPRNIDSFRTDLNDSLVLMAVTASYCPYLIPHYFLDVFHTPENHEQIYHNAIKLTNAWREVNIALTVEPKDIVSSNCVFMLMIVAHLYEILPLLSPRSFIRFTAPLTKEMTRSIDLVNRLDEKIVYYAKFIGLQEGSFKLVSHSPICIRARRTHDFKIAYRAKNINKVCVTLLLDGAYMSPNFAKSIVFQLEGEPSELTEYAKINLHGYLYKVICMEVPISSPYPDDTQYEISYSTVSPNADPKLLEMKPWRDIWDRKTSRRLFINQTTLDYYGNVPALLNVTIACLTTDLRKFWLLFHSDVGDFIVRIDVSTKVLDSPCGAISVTLPSHRVCSCSDVKKSLSKAATSTCPLLLYLRVPVRNYNLWETMFTMFQKTLDPKEKMFWKQHFETNIGIRLIKWLLSQDESPEVTEEFIPSLRTNVTYSLKIDANANKYITIAPTIEIPDVRVRETIYLPIHVSAKTPSDLKVTLTMKSDSKKEIRTIKYAFISCEDEPLNSVK